MKEHLNGLNKCIKVCNEIIDAFEDLIECSSQNRACNRAIDVCIEKSKDSSIVSNKCIQDCETHLKKCGEKTCVDAAEKCIVACKEFLRKNEQFLQAWKNPKNDTILRLTEECIEASDNCIKKSEFAISKACKMCK